MGGDRAPEEVAHGAFLAASSETRVVLVGPPDVLQRHLAQAGPAGAFIEAVDASQVVAMGESPTEAWREKKDSSIVVGLRLVKDGRADAFVSAGNTGAIVAASLFVLGTMEGIDRPAIATLYTTRNNTIAMALDIGANAECRPSFLVQFGQLGSAFLKKVLKVPNPRVGLLSNGEEETKGPKVIKEAHRLLKRTDLNFIGNIEGFDVHSGAADVIVMDGFTGNVLLKFAEGLTEAIFLSLKDALDGNLLARASKPLWGPPIMSVVRQWDYSAIGGAPLLGVNGNVVMAHGRSNAADIKNAIALGVRMVREGWLQQSAPPNRQPSVSHLTTEESAAQPT